jgi:hypothetical protein
VGPSTVDNVAGFAVETVAEFLTVNDPVLVVRGLGGHEVLA